MNTAKIYSYSLLCYVGTAMLVGCQHAQSQDQARNTPKEQDVTLKSSLQWSNSSGGPGMASYTVNSLRSTKKRVQWEHVSVAFIQGIVPAGESVVLIKTPHDPVSGLTFEAQSLSSIDGSKQWSVNFPGATSIGLPVYAGEGYVVFPTQSATKQEIVALRDSKRLWSYDFESTTDGVVNTSSTGEVVFVGLALASDKYSCIAIDRDTGKELYQIDEIFVPASVGSLSFAITRNGALICFESLSGVEKWRKEYSIAYGSFIQSGRLVWIDQEDTIVALNIEANKTETVHKLSAEVVSFALGDATIFVAQSDELIAIDFHTGAVRWRLSGAYGNVIASKDGTLLVSHGHDIVLLDGLTAKKLWTFEVVGSLLQICITDDGQIIFATIEGYVMSLQ